MKHKMMLLAAAALSILAFAALPSMASAFETTPAVTPTDGNGFPLKFTSTSGEGILWRNNGTFIKCTADTNTGEFENAHTGKVTIMFTGCKDSVLGSKCTSAGAPEAGTITTTTLPFHTVYLKPADPLKPHERPGILITPNSEVTENHFASFTCASGLVKVVVKGNGVLGTITKPAIGGTSTTATLKVSATEKAQEHTETVEGQKFGLEASQNGGAFEPAFENAGEDLIEFHEKAGEATREVTTTTETP